MQVTKSQKPGEQPKTHINHLRLVEKKFYFYFQKFKHKWMKIIWKLVID